MQAKAQIVNVIV